MAGESRYAATKVKSKSAPGVGSWFGPGVVVGLSEGPDGYYLSASKLSKSAEVTVYFGPFEAANHEQPTPKTPPPPGAPFVPKAPTC